MGHSNLVHVKKNKTTKWLSNLSEQRQGGIVDLAIKKDDKYTRIPTWGKTEIRTEKAEHGTRKCQERSIKEKNYKMRKKLLRLHLITTSEELKKELLNIESEKISAFEKRNKNYTFEHTN